ncbi:MAG: FAD-binding oxidoreductase [Anaerolineae bacterium]|nr:FAD-binding oxidoreductase [Anaerolineae bacterium]
MKHYESWGRYPALKPRRVVPIHWRDDLPDFTKFERPVLAYGYGRSYGDSCLNEDGVLLDPTFMRRFIQFDQENGLLRCEAGVSLAEILDLIVPQGWFLSVVPGTKFISVGGAIANDVHGKNHHVSGTFGLHVTQFELVRSNGEHFICSPTENTELYQATIGGLGLTGLILWAEMKLKRIPSPFIEVEEIRFGSVDEFFEIAEESDQTHEYSVSWIDCLAGGRHLGRGIFTRGNFHKADPFSRRFKKPGFKPRVPFDFPPFMLNKLTTKAFNTVIYYRALHRKRVRKIQSYEPFFFPLDIILDWNKGYGKPGFLQYQFVLPIANKDYTVIKDILFRIHKSDVLPFLNVFKTFGDVKSPGMMSFPKPGVTLALDLPYRGAKTLRFLDELDAIIRANGGVLYPAKDARMSPETFRASFPNWQDFTEYIDPKFSSSFWRRVTRDQQNGKPT